MSSHLEKFVPECPTGLFPRDIWFSVLEYAEIMFPTNVVDTIMSHHLVDAHIFLRSESHIDRIKKISRLAPDVQLMIKDVIIQYFVGREDVIENERKNPRPLIYYMATFDELLTGDDAEIRNSSDSWHLLITTLDGYRFCDFRGLLGERNECIGVGIIWKIDDLKYQPIFIFDDSTTDHLDPASPHYGKIVKSYERRYPVHGDGDESDGDSCECVSCKC